MKLKVGWKVFRYSNNILTSAIERKFGGGLDYPIGKIIKPKRNCGPLTVFTKFENARKFYAALYGQFKIRKILYRPSKLRTVWSTCSVDNRLREVSLGELIEDNSKIGLTLEAVDLASVVYVLDEI